MINKISSENKLNTLLTSGKRVNLDSTRNNSDENINIGSDVVESDVMATSDTYTELLDEPDKISCLSEVATNGSLRMGIILDPDNHNIRTLISLNELPIMDKIGRKKLATIEKELQVIINDYIKQGNADWLEADPSKNTFILNKPDNLLTTDGGVINGPLLINGTLSTHSDLNLHGNNIINVGTPRNATDGISKRYLEEELSSFAGEFAGARTVSVDSGNIYEIDQNRNINLDLSSLVHYSYDDPANVSTKYIPDNLIKNKWLQFEIYQHNGALDWDDLDPVLPSITRKNKLFKLMNVPFRVDENGKPIGVDINGVFWDNYSYVLYDDEGFPHPFGAGHTDSVNGVFPINKNVTINATDILSLNVNNMGTTKNISVNAHLSDLYNTIYTLTDIADNAGDVVLGLIKLISIVETKIAAAEIHKVDSNFANTLVENLKFVSSEMGLKLEVDFKSPNPQIEDNVLTALGSSTSEVVTTVGGYESYNEEYDTRFMVSNEYKGIKADIIVPNATLTNSGVLSAVDYKRLQDAALDATVVHNTGNENVSGIKDFKDNVTVSGNLNIVGNIFHQGSAYDLQAETLNVKDNYIALRTSENILDDAPALLSNETAGIIIKDYNGHDDVGLITNNKGELRIGEYNVEMVNGVVRVLQDDTQPVLTRAETSNMIDGKFIKWNSTNISSNTSDITPEDIIVSDEYIPTNNAIVNKKYIDDNYTKSNMRPLITTDVSLNSDGISINTSTIDKDNIVVNKTFRVDNATILRDGLQSKEDKNKLENLDNSIETAILVKGINTTDNSGAVVDLVVDKTATIPRPNYLTVSGIGNIAVGYEGLMVFDIATKLFWIYKGGQFVELYHGDERLWYGKDIDFPLESRADTTYFSWSNSDAASFEHGGLSGASGDIFSQAGAASGEFNYEYAGGA